MDCAVIEQPVASCRVEARRGLVLAAGAWTGQLLDAALAVQPTWAPLFRPRRGHLLELQPPASMPRLQHGLMEVSYTQVKPKLPPLAAT